MPFRPVTSVITPKTLAGEVARRHTVAVVPLYTTTPPNAAEVRAVIDEAMTFWEKEVPGLRIATRILPAKRLAAACDRNVGKAWEAAKRAAHINAYATGNHVLAYAPGCGNYAGIATLRAGSGVMYVGAPDAGIVAHEFGHNLGLSHANDLQCRSGGKPVSLSRSCTEFEYGNQTAIMGNGELFEGVRSGPIAQAAFTGRVRLLSPTGTSSATLSATPKGLQAVAVKSRLGTVYLTARQSYSFSSATETVEKGPLQVQAEVLTKEGSGLLHFPEVAHVSSGGLIGLQLGNVWDVPGSRTRVIVTGVGDSTVSLKVVARPGTPERPAAPQVIVPAGGTYPATEAWTLDWTGADANAVAFIVTAGDRVVARVPGSARSAMIPPRVATDEAARAGGTVPMRVIAVGPRGGTAGSEPVALTPLRPGLVIASSASAENVTAPFRLTWSVTPASSLASVASWVIDYADQTFTLPASQTWFDVDPGLAYWGGYATVQIQGLSAQGDIVLQGFYDFTMPESLS